jgi:hypothetical protein
MLGNNDYVKRFYTEARATKMSTGAGIIVLLQNHDGGEAQDIKYSTLNQILKNKPSDLIVADLEKGKFQFMTLKSVLEKEKQKKEPEPYDHRCSCCDE